MGGLHRRARSGYNPVAARVATRPPRQPPANANDAVKRIQSRDNPLFKTLHRLATSSRERRQTGAALLDGPHLIEAFAAGGGTAEAIVAGESGMEIGEVRALFERTPARNRAIMTDRLFEQCALVASPVGIMAWIAVPDPGPLPEHPRDCILLEEIQDAGNLGSILRTARAAGVRDIYLSRGCVFAWAPKVLRAGMGAHFGLSIYENVDLASIAGRAEGAVVATMLDGKDSLYGTDLRGPIAWIFGNEGAGISPVLADRAERRLKIPLPEGAESLNVGAAVAVCLFEQVRQRRFSTRDA